MNQLTKLLLAFSTLITMQVQALQPPTQEQLKRYKTENSLSERAKKARTYGNHKRLQHLPQLKAIQNQTAEANPFEGYFPSLGSPKMLVLLVEFPDYLHAENNSQSAISSKIFGEGESTSFPFESQRAYYQRASYNQLDIQGNVLDWYKTDYNRPIDDGNNTYEVKQQIIKEAIEHHDALGHDFSQYDNDGDGDIDYVAVIWTGPPGEWASLWWGTFSGFGDNSFTVDGKTISTISWQWLSYNEGDAFSPLVLIHETGHALGLPDYYDYDDSIGPRGGTGGMDMMDNNSSDHSAFSKFALGWLTPQFATTSVTNYQLSPTSTSQDALILRTDTTATNKYDEYFIVQYRNKTGNDTNIYAEGLNIWHINAGLNDWGYFANDNSYSDNKLIRLIQADNLDEIELLNANANADDVFNTGDTFSPQSMPSSKNYSAKHTGVDISNITINDSGANITAQVYPNIATFSVDSIIDKSLISHNAKATISSDDLSQVAQLELLINGESKTTVSAPFEINLEDYISQNGQLDLQFNAITPNGYKSAEHLKVFAYNGESAGVHFHLDHELNTDTKQIYDSLTLPVYYADFLFPLTSTNFKFVSIDFGNARMPWQRLDDGTLRAYSRNRAASANEVSLIDDYTRFNSKIIVAGENAFNLSPELSSTLGVTALQNEIYVEKIESVELSNGQSINETIYSQNSVSPPVSDFIEKTDSTTFLTATGQYYDWDAGEWKTESGNCGIQSVVNNAKLIVNTCSLSHLSSGSQAALISHYLNYLEIEDTVDNNLLPVIQLDTSVTINEGDEFEITATVNDADNDPITLLWQQTSGTTVTIEDDTSATLAFTAPQLNASEALTFSLTANDGKGSTTAFITVNVIHINKLPMIDLASSITVVANEQVTIDATVSDEDGDSLTYQWQQISGPTVALNNETTTTLSFTAPEVSVDTAMEFALSVSDGEGSVTGYVQVNVKRANEAPTVTLGNNITVNEGESVNLTAQASDPDGDNLSYNWVQTSGPTVSLSSTTDANISFTAPNVESNQVLTFEVTVSDSNLTSTASIQVTVQNIPVSPVTEVTESSSGGSVFALLGLLTLISLRRKI
ncbi:M6 family metalloprotease domain-containing protein [Pseudoalteromonas sp. G4]|uniref:M6 family metalloprotease domain-containing protein n=1 Tax=Pseudoalteromonas sp. G4 TaxID=2992761 RepID=UPI00237E097A|nr:M6 family metalloprotease domain-containing protein [Pseudoalteromonas sp. G4]MDE3273787.1 M6 family metalloprotease domain-containing protein [Pseudoalteromonas sp. G4]